MRPAPTTTTGRGALAPPRGVDLWCVPLGGATAREARLIACCSAREHARAAGMPIVRRRRRFLVGRGIARSILGAYLGVAPGAVELGAGEHGKPFVLSADAPAFSVSHSRDLIVVAVSPGFDVGVDVEWIDRTLDVMAIARRFLSAEEEADLVRLPAEQRTTAFLRLWTGKEARLKSTGGGFAGGPGAGAATLVEIAPGPGYVGALAYDAPPAPLHIPDNASAGL
jgi:4'-phosphopantetheinyl transferase